MLDGELTPIPITMVKSASINGLLDKEGETSYSIMCGLHYNYSLHFYRVYWR